MFTVLSIKERRSEAYLFEFEADKQFICYYFGSFSLHPTILIKEKGNDIILDRLILFDLAIHLRKFLFNSEPDIDAILEDLSDYLDILNGLNRREIPQLALFNELRWSIYKLIEKNYLISFSKLLELSSLKFYNLSLKDLEESLRILEIANLISIESIYGELIAQLERKVILYAEYGNFTEPLNNWKILEIFLNPKLKKLLLELRRKEKIPTDIAFKDNLVKKLLNLGILKKKNEKLIPSDKVVLKIIDIAGDIIFEEII